MATQNFVVHNGLTVGALTIDAATSNVSLPVTKQLAIGNVILRDNGDGKLHIRDITDNADAELIGTVGAISTTSGNIQIGTNHIESTNTNGPITLRPSGTGPVGLFSNTIAIGRGGDVTIGTGLDMPDEYGVDYTAGNIVLSPGNGKIVKINANLEVLGTQTVFNTNNLSITDGLIYLADGNPSNLIDLGFVTAFTDPGYQHAGLARDATDGIWKLFANVVAEPTTTVDFTNATYSDLKVGNITPGVSNLSSLGSTTLWWNKIWGVSVNAQYADLAENYVADNNYEPGTVVHFGGEFEVTACDVDMCTRVAGVVSTNPAYLMNATQQGELVVPVALTGRVPTKVTGTVHKGDMMVSAGSGRARAEANPRVGSVIGKALQDSEGDTVIEVVVGKH